MIAIFRESPEWFPLGEGEGRRVIKHAEHAGPLGLLVELDDPLHTRYRVHEGRFRTIERVSERMRFNLTVLASQLTESGRSLPTHFVVTTRDPKTRAVTSVTAVSDSYSQQGELAIPVKRIAVSHSAEGEQIRSLSLSEVELGRRSPGSSD